MIIHISIPAGYKYCCALYSWSSGTVFPTYIEGTSVTKNSIDIFNASEKDHSNATIYVAVLFIKNR